MLTPVSRTGVKDPRPTRTRLAAHRILSPYLEVQTLQNLSVTFFETPILYALPTPEADAEFAENANQVFSSTFSRTVVTSRLNLTNRVVYNS